MRESLQEAGMLDENFWEFVGIPGSYISVPQRVSWLYCVFCWGHVHSCLFTGFILIYKASHQKSIETYNSNYDFSCIMRLPNKRNSDFAFWVLRLGLSWISTQKVQIIMLLWITYFRREDLCNETNYVFHFSFLTGWVKHKETHKKVFWFLDEN